MSANGSKSARYTYEQSNNGIRKSNSKNKKLNNINQSSSFDFTERAESQIELHKQRMIKANQRKKEEDIAKLMKLYGISHKQAKKIYKKEQRDQTNSISVSQSVESIPIRTLYHTSKRGAEPVVSAPDMSISDLGTITTHQMASSSRKKKKKSKTPRKSSNNNNNNNSNSNSTTPRAQTARIHNKQQETSPNNSNKNKKKKKKKKLKSSSMTPRFGEVSPKIYNSTQHTIVELNSVEDAQSLKSAKGRVVEVQRYDLHDGIYTGKLLKNVPNGYGVMQFHNGGTYEGQWRHGFRHGNGTLHYPSGNMYRGHWVDGRKHGFGIFIYADGDCYEGEWSKGKKHGYGEFSYKKSGDRYEGDWKNDLRHGNGTYRFTSLGHRYVGEWKRGVAHGAGIFYYGTVEPCNRFVGHWHHDLRHGEGILYFGNKKKKPAVIRYVHGQLVSNSKSKKPVDIKIPWWKCFFCLSKKEKDLIEKRRRFQRMNTAQRQGIMTVAGTGKAVSRNKSINDPQSTQEREKDLAAKKDVFERRLSEHKYGRSDSTSVESDDSRKSSKKKKKKKSASKPLPNQDDDSNIRPHYGTIM